MSRSRAGANLGYAMIKSGPEVDPDDVESDSTAIEVMVLWGSSVLRVAHLSPSHSFYVGDDSLGNGIQCDCFMPGAALGATRAPIVVSRAECQRLVMWPGARGHVDIPGEGQVSLASLVGSGRADPSTAMRGAYEYDLPPAAKATIEIEGSDLTFHISAINAGKRLPVGWLANGEPEEFLYTVLSFVLHAGLVAAMAFFMPRLHGDDGEAIDADRILVMQKLLDASADREFAVRETHENENSWLPEPGGSGAASRGEAGTMGTPKANEAGHRYAIVGPKDNPDPHMAKRIAMQEATQFAAISVLQAMPSSDPNAPTVAWGREESSGADPRSALGNLIGDTIGQALGTGGLTLSGVGEAGDGNAEAIGLNDLGSDFGHGHGPGTEQGIAVGSGRPNGGHPVRPVGMRDSTPTVNGRIPKEVIQRIVHQNFGRFRLCYENGLRSNPRLEGRLNVKFAIDRTGAVMMAADGGSDLPDRSVVACAVRSFSNLSFPSPEGGMVTVLYGFDLSPG